MSTLIFEKQVDLFATTGAGNHKVNSNCIINEPDNELVQYYITPQYLAEDQSEHIIYGNYDNLKWGNKQKRLTSRNVSRIGLKAFPGVGAIAFFKYKYEQRSLILCPVNNNRTDFNAPELSISSTPSTLIFNISDPKDITYQCYRIILRNGHFAIEYITYEKTLSVPMPDVKGEYQIYCIGYVNEGEYISYESNVLVRQVFVGQDSFAPDPNVSYFTKAEIEQLLANIIPKQYLGDNETINIDQDTGIVSVAPEYREIIEGSSSSGDRYTTGAPLKSIDPIKYTSLESYNEIHIIEED